MRSMLKMIRNLEPLKGLVFIVESDSECAKIVMFDLNNNLLQFSLHLSLNHFPRFLPALLPALLLLLVSLGNNRRILDFSSFISLFGRLSLICFSHLMI